MDSARLWSMMMDMTFHSNSTRPITWYSPTPLGVRMTVFHVQSNANYPMSNARLWGTTQYTSIISRAFPLLQSIISLVYTNKDIIQNLLPHACILLEDFGLQCGHTVWF